MRFSYLFLLFLLLISTSKSFSQKNKIWENSLAYDSPNEVYAIRILEKYRPAEEYREGYLFKNPQGFDKGFNCFCNLEELYVRSLESLNKIFEDSFLCARITKLHIERVSFDKKEGFIRGLPNLKELFLEGQRIDYFPKLIGFDSLQKLELSFDQIQDLTCNTKIPNLSSLDIFGWSVDSLDVGSFSTVKHLYLSSGNTDIYGVGNLKVEGIDQLTNLERLETSNTVIENLNLSENINLKSLSIDLKENAQLILSSILFPENIEELDIRLKNTQSRLLRLDAFSSLKKLKLSNVEGFKSLGLHRMNQLETFFVQKCDFDTMDFTTFSSPKLRKVTTIYCFYTNTFCGDFSHLPSLDSLVICSNNYLYLSSFKNSNIKYLALRCKSYFGPSREDMFGLDAALISLQTKWSLLPFHFQFSENAKTKSLELNDKNLPFFIANVSYFQSLETVLLTTSRIQRIKEFNEALKKLPNLKKASIYPLNERCISFVQSLKEENKIIELRTTFPATHFLRPLSYDFNDDGYIIDFPLKKKKLF